MAIHPPPPRSTLHVLHVVSALGPRALSRQAVHVASGGRHADLTATLLASRRGGALETDATARGLRVAAVPMDRSASAALPGVVSAMQTQRPDIVHAWGDGAAMVAGVGARLLGVPLVVTPSGPEPGRRPVVTISGTADRVVLTPRLARERRRYVGERAVVIPPALFDESPLVGRGAARRTLGISGDGPVFGLVGRFTDDGGAIGRLLQVLAVTAHAEHTSPWRVALVGPLAPAVRARLRAADPQRRRLLLCGEVGDLLGLWSAFDAVLALDDRPDLPLAAHEASAAGCAVLATRGAPADDDGDDGDAEVWPDVTWIGRKPRAIYEAMRRFASARVEGGTPLHGFRRPPGRSARAVAVAHRNVYDDAVLALWRHAPLPTAGTAHAADRVGDAGRGEPLPSWSP